MRLTMSLHYRQEIDNDFGGRTNEDLTLSTALGVDDAVQCVVLDLL